MTRPPFMLDAGAGETIQGPAGGPLTFKVRGSQSSGSLTALETVIAPLDGPPLHTHDAQDETLYVLDGAFRFLLGDRLETAAAGAFVFVPRGSPHCFQNIGSNSARLLITFTPAGMEQFFDDFAASDSTDPEVFARLGAPAGMTVLGPPLRVSHP